MRLLCSLSLTNSALEFLCGLLAITIEGTSATALSEALSSKPLTAKKKWSVYFPLGLVVHFWALTILSSNFFPLISRRPTVLFSGINFLLKSLASLPVGTVDDPSRQITCSTLSFGMFLRLQSRLTAWGTNQAISLVSESLCLWLQTPTLEENLSRMLSQTLSLFFSQLGTSWFVEQLPEPLVSLLCTAFQSPHEQFRYMTLKLWLDATIPPQSQKLHPQLWEARQQSLNYKPKGADEDAPMPDAPAVIVLGEIPLAFLPKHVANLATAECPPSPSSILKRKRQQFEGEILRCSLFDIFDKSSGLCSRLFSSPHRRRKVRLPHKVADQISHKISEIWSSGGTLRHSSKMLFVSTQPIHTFFLIPLLLFLFSI